MIAYIILHLITIDILHIFFDQDDNVRCTLQTYILSSKYNTVLVI